ncbi:hypothetical protein ACLKA6_000581 [Drosophila palustris]
MKPQNGTKVTEGTVCEVAQWFSGSVVGCTLNLLMIEQDINLTERWQAGDRIQAASLYKGEQDNGEDEKEEREARSGCKGHGGQASKSTDQL